MECVNFSILPSSYIVNVIRGQWVNIEDSGLDQLLINYYTHFTVFAVNDLFDSIKKIHDQPFFAPVRYVEKGPVVNSLSSFYELLPTTVLQLVYDANESLFVKVIEIQLPSLCVNPSYIKMLMSSLVVSCAHGGICAFSLDGYSLIYEEKPTNAVLFCFESDNDTISRIECDKCVASYGGIPFERTTRELPLKKLINAFSFRSNQTIYCTKKKIYLQKENKIALISLPDTPAGSIDPIISYCMLFTKESYILLSQSGNLYLLKQDAKLKILRNVPGASSVFFVAINLILIQRKGDTTILFDYKENTIKQEIDANWGMLDLAKGKNGEYFSHDSRKFNVYKFGIQCKLNNSFEFDEPFDNVIPFTHKGGLMFILSNNDRSMIVNKNFAIIEDFPINFCKETKTKELCIFSVKNNVFFFQIADSCYYQNGEKMESRYSLKKQLICYAKSDTQLIMIFDNRERVYISFAKNSADLITTTRCEVDYKPSCIAIQPKTNGVLAVGTKENDLFFYNISHAHYEEKILLTAKLHDTPTSILFANQNVLMISFACGDLVVGVVTDESFEQSQKVKTGSSPCVLSAKNGIGYASSPESTWIVRYVDDSLVIMPIIGISNAYKCAKPIENGRSFITTTEKGIDFYNISNINETFRQESFSVEDLGDEEIIGFETIKGTNFSFVLTKKKVFLYENASKKLKLLFPKTKEGEIEEFSGELIQLELSIEDGILAFLTRTDEKYKINYMSVRLTNKSPRFKYPIAIDVHFHVTSFCIVNGKLALASESSISIYACNAKSITFISTTKIDGGEIEKIIFSGENLYVQCQDKTIKCYECSHDMMSIKYKASSFSQNITKGTAFSDSIITGDRNGNVVVYSKPAFGMSFIPRVASINVGSVVSGVCFRHAGISVGLYLTIFGDVGVLGHIGNDESLKMRSSFLKKVELLVADEYNTLTGAKALVFRNSNYPCTSLLDLDIVSLLFEMSEQRQAKICKKISTNMTVERILTYYNELRTIISYLSV